ncbi:MAG TPA: aminotransferase class V-fold PLP-dependent enzyme [Gammaproteobacteria bacterium]|nr:aminotransferase class V-fold PLP-dependent enzyme [Gammaproteobacteria bacterium]
MSRKPVYLDYAATTPVDPAVIAAMLPCLGPEGCFANPASVTHAPGREARKAVEAARGEIAALVGAASEEIIFTSGATESDNLALKGVMRSRGGACHLVTVRTEHKAVLDTAHRLEGEGFHVTYLTPQVDGRIRPEALAAAIREDTALVSIMWVNNEIGVMQDIAALGAVCRERGLLFHVDAAQGAGKLPLDLGSLPVDLMSFSGHKLYGPKGIGALYVRRAPHVRLEAMVHGGGHEGGLRSGTLATHQIVGMGRAFAIARERLADDAEHARRLSRRLHEGLAALGGVEVNGAQDEWRAPPILNLAFDGIVSDSLLYFLTDVAVSTGSACSSASRAPSYVLKALGLSDARARSSLRLSVGRFTTVEDVDFAIAHIGDAVRRLRAIAPASAAG